MATIKSYTDIPQSKVLADILPLESADNVIVSFGSREGTKTIIMPKETLDVIRTPFADIRETTMCWSLSALLGVLSSATLDTLDSSDNHHYRLRCVGRCTEWHDNAIDVCYEMIVRLHGLNLL